MSELPDGTHTAVVDRLEDELAALEVTTEAERFELNLEVARLPSEARHADAVLTLTVEDGALTDISYDADETVERRERSQSRFDRLSSRPPDDDS